MINAQQRKGRFIRSKLLECQKLHQSNSLRSTSTVKVSRRYMRINVSSIKDAVKLSNRQFDSAVEELERTGLIVVLDDVQEVRLVS
jgi:hypothetical protein